MSPSTVPPRPPIRVLTLSREYGAGGSELGLRLAEVLGWPLLDQDLAQRIADHLHATQADVAALDERVPTWRERLAQVFSVVPSDAPILPDPSLRTPNPDDLVAVSQVVLRDAVARPPLIVVGHGANILFRGRLDLLRVRVSAPFDVRVQRVAARTGVTLYQAAADVRHRDADRSHYLQRYYRSDPKDSTLYDLQLNTATISLDLATRLVVSVIHAADAIAAGE